MLKNDPSEIVLAKDEPEALRPIAERIRELLASYKRDIVAAVNGSGSDVGKSYVSGAVHRMLLESDVCVAPGSDRGNLRNAMVQLAAQKEANDYSQGVILLGAAGENFATRTKKEIARLRRNLNVAIANVSEGALSRIDLWIGVYRPDRPFAERHVLADILVRNEGATDKGRFSH